MQWSRSIPRTNEPVYSRPSYPDNQENGDQLMQEDILRTLHTDRFQKRRFVESALPPKRRRFSTKDMMDPQKIALREQQSSQHLPVKNSRIPLFSGPISSLLLRPCHICHRRPTTRAVLGGYVDCEDCGKRTCFICMRECDDDGCRYAEWIEGGMVVDGLQGTTRPHSRRRRICSSCSVEKIDSEGQDTVTCVECHFTSRS